MPRGYKNAIARTDAEIAADAVVDSTPGANAPAPAEPAPAAPEAAALPDVQVDEAGKPLAAVSEDLSAEGYYAKLASQVQEASVHPEPWPSETADAQPETADEPQLGFELVDAIPAARRPKLKYADVVAFLRANPGQAVKIQLGAKTSANGASQTIRANFPDITVQVRTAPDTGIAAAYAVCAKKGQVSA